MTRTPHTTSRRGRLAVMSAAALLLMTGCEPSLPQDPSQADPVIGDPATSELAEEPTFLPYTTAPTLRNRDEVVAALREGYPTPLREAGVGGTVRVWFHLDTEGRVTHTRIDESSGHAPLDEAALRVAEVFRFTPARNDEEPTPVWISLPIAFQPR